MKERAVIVGASHAAAEAVSVLRKKGWGGDIVLIGDELSLPYHRPPLSKAYYKGDVSAEKLLIKGEVVYQNAQVDLKLGRRVNAIDRDARLLSLDNGERVAYTKLILATGTRARTLPVSGADLPQIHSLRTLRDVDQIKSQIPENGHLLIVGAGYIGLEVAASAIKQGVKVTVLEAMDRVLARVTSPVISDFYQDVHSQEGVDIRLNSALNHFAVDDGTHSAEVSAAGISINRPKRVKAVMSDGEEIPFDCAIVGIGVLPNSELAEDAGLSCDNGIVVNEFTQTCDPDIYAVGDCSNHPSFLYDRRIRLESVPNAVEQAKTAALSICGENVAYDQAPWFWSDQYDIKLQTVGLLTGYDDYVIRGDIAARKFSVFYLREGRLIAMDAVNSPADFMLSRKLIAAMIMPDKAHLGDAGFSLKKLL